MSATTEQCPSCGAGEIVVKKFTLPSGDDGTVTVLDYYCPSCGRLVIARVINGSESQSFR